MNLVEGGKKQAYEEWQAGADTGIYCRWGAQKLVLKFQFLTRIYKTGEKAPTCTPLYPSLTVKVGGGEGAEYDKENWWYRADNDNDNPFENRLTISWKGPWV